jgi:hypothetical protein
MTAVYCCITTQVQKDLSKRDAILKTKTKRIGSINESKSLLSHDPSVLLERPDRRVERAMGMKMRSSGCPRLSENSYQRLWFVDGANDPLLKHVHAPQVSS